MEFIPNSYLDQRGQQGGGPRLSLESRMGVDRRRGERAPISLSIYDESRNFRVRGTFPSLHSLGPL
jgi:hypothetical protein